MPLAFSFMSCVYFIQQVLYHVLPTNADDQSLKYVKSIHRYVLYQGKCMQASAAGWMHTKGKRQNS